MTMRPADVARLLLLGTIWGSSFVLIKVGLNGFEPLQMVATRIVVAAAVVVAFLRLKGVGLPRERADWAPLIVMAVISNLIPFFLIIWGEQYIDSSLAAILNSTTPLFTAVIAAAVLAEERLGAVRAAGTVLGFVGVGVIVGINPEGSGTLFVLGQIATVVAAASYGVGFVYARRHLTAKGSPLRNAAGQLVMASVLSLPLAGVESISGLPTFGWAPTLCVLGLGVIGTGFAYVVYYRLVADVGPTTASFVTYLIPVVGVVLGWLVLDERLGWNVLIGTVLVIGGIALAEKGRRPVPAAGLQPARETKTAHP